MQEATSFGGFEIMKRILLAGAAFAALTTASFAADLSAPIEEVDVWSGYYVGIQGGFAWGDLTVDAVTAARRSLLERHGRRLRWCLLG